jgi:hypothetical protein
MPPQPITATFSLEFGKSAANKNGPCDNRAAAAAPAKTLPCFKKSRRLDRLDIFAPFENVIEQRYSPYLSSATNAVDSIS